MKNFLKTLLIGCAIFATACSSENKDSLKIETPNTDSKSVLEENDKKCKELIETQIKDYKNSGVFNPIWYLPSELEKATKIEFKNFYHILISSENNVWGYYTDTLIYAEGMDHFFFSADRTGDPGLGIFRIYSTINISSFTFEQAPLCLGVYGE